MITDKLQSESSIAKPLDSLEESITNDVREPARNLLQGHINSLGIGDAGGMIFSVTGEKLSHKRIPERTIYTVFGEVRLARVGYSNRNHGSLFPSDLHLNLPIGSFSYGLQKMSVREVIKSSFEEGLEAVNNSTKINIGKRQAIEIIDRCAQDFDLFYENRLPAINHLDADTIPIMVLTTDGKGIIMRTDSLREDTKKRSQKTEKK